jgi:predicted RNase H-like HicB family nuclease
MEKVLVSVELSENNYSAYLDQLPGCVSTGKTFEELKKNIQEAIEFHLDTSREFNDEISSVFDGDFELVYKFDTSSLLQHYRGIFTNSALERITGINQRQLQRYATGESKPRAAQVEKIANAFHSIGRELLIVEL